MTITLAHKERLTQDGCQALGCHCDTCTLRTDNPFFFKPVPGHGNPDARLVIVGEAPGNHEAFQGRPFVGESGSLLNETLRRVGLTRRDVYVTNAVLCQPPQNRDPKKSEIAACRDRLRQEILRLPRRHVIVVAGNTAVRVVTDRTENISALVTRTGWSDEFGCFILYSYHPAACLRSVDDYADVLWTFQRAVQLLDKPLKPLCVQEVPYLLETDAEKAVTRLTWMEKHLQGLCAADIETAGEDALDWKTAEITQIGFYSPHMGKAYLLPAPIFADFAVRSALHRLFARRNVQWVWHNGKFDVQFLKKAGFSEARVDIDTMLLHKCLNEREKGHGLKALVAKYFGDSDYAEQKEGFTDPQYHAKDCFYTYMLVDVLRREAAQEPPSLHGYPNPLYRHDHVLAPAWNAIADVEWHGVALDLAYLKTLKTTMCATLEAIEKECQQLAGVRFPERQTKTQLKLGEPAKTRPINIRSNKDLHYLVYSVYTLPLTYAKGNKTGNPTVNAEMLGAYRHLHPFIDRLLEYRELHKLYSVYVLGAEKASHVDGAVHTHFSFNPVTGRSSSADLNIQNIPKDSPIKPLYIARPGHLFVQADYSNQEVRVASLLARDPVLRAACMSSDFHTVTARGMFASVYAEIDACNNDLSAVEALLERRPDFHQIALVHKNTPLTATELTTHMHAHLRKCAKAVTFGTLYGTGAEGLQATLWRSAKIALTCEAAEEYIASWLLRYPKTAAWRAAMRREIVEYGFVDTHFGHRRRKPLITGRTRGESERQAMNAPIQSLSSDMTMLAIIRLHKELCARRWGHILFFVHDSLAFEIRTEYLTEALILIKEVMEHALDEIQSTDFYVPFPVDIEVGTNWGNVQTQWEHLL